MINYTQLDENNKVIAISQLSGKVDKPNMIEIEEYDSNLLGKLYDGGEFIDMNYYAELNNESIVNDIVSNPSNKSTPRNWNNKIPIEHQNYDLIGCKYTNGEFIRVDPQVEAIKEIIAPVIERLNKIETKLSNL